MSDPEQVAFTFLSFAGDREVAEGVLRKTWAVDRAAAFTRALDIADIVESVGEAYIARANAPAWIAVAAHRSGIALPETVKLHQDLRARLSQQPVPVSIVDWARLMIAILSGLSPHELQRILPKSPYGDSSRLSAIYSFDLEARVAAWTAYERALAAWMTGKPLIEVAAEIHSRPVNDDPSRGPQDPLPRTITVVGDGFRFGLSMIAGTLGAIVATGREEDPEGPWTLEEESLRCLTLLPLAVRSGASTPAVLAWIRAGVQPRVAAHIISEMIRLPNDNDDDQLQRWAYRRLTELLAAPATDAADPLQQLVIGALQTVRDSR